MISSPDLRASRSRLADWLELRALFGQHEAGEADLASVSRFGSDDHRERMPDAANSIVEDEILDSGAEETADRVSQEIGERARILGDEYPFTVSNRPFGIALKDVGQLTPPHWAYLFMLLLTGERDKMLPKSPKVDGLVRAGRNLFHVCASIGVAGLMRNAHTIWFGFPRPDGTGFLEALANVCQKLGCGQAKDRPPPGLPSSPQDDQIDVVGWRSFRDRRNGNLLILCQAATGEKWDEKSIFNHVDAFKDWFAILPYARATTSIALPFPAHHEVGEHPAEGYEVAVHNSLNRSQNRHGVLIDRVRIVESVFDVSADGKSAGNVGGIEKLTELKDWVTNAILAIREAA